MKVLDQEQASPNSLRNRATMRAASLSAPRRIEVVEAPVPEPAANELLVRLEGCGVCASNIPPWEGKPWFSYPMPAGALGHEGWGKVVKIGSAVTNFAVGDRVAMISNNAYAQFDLADASAAVRLPVALQAQPFPAEPLGCAMNIFRRSNIDKENTVAIVGIGFLGALLCQLAHVVGARVIAITRRQFAREMAKQMNADHTIGTEDHAAAVAEVARLTNGQLCDVVIEATGKQAPLSLASELTRERGRLVVAGYHQDGAREINMQLWNWRGIDVINAHERDPLIYREGMEQAVRAVETGLLNPTPLYTHIFQLSQLGDALEMTAARPDGFMKALIDLR